MKSKLTIFFIIMRHTQFFLNNIAYAEVVVDY